MARLVKNSVIYTLGTVLRQVVGFLMLPIYTSHLGPSDYGVVEMLSVVASLLALLAGVNIGLATVRFYYDLPTEKEKNSLLSSSFFSTAFLGVIAYALLFLVAASPVGGVLSNALLGDASQVKLLMIFSLMIIFQPMEEFLFMRLRLLDFPWQLVGLSTLKLALQLSLNVYFVVYVGMKAEGVVYGAVISTGMMAILAIAVVVFRVARFPTLKSGIMLVKFAIPLTIAAAGFLYMSLSDRYLLQFLRGTEEVGIYALGCRFAEILNVLGWLPFMAVWQTRRFEIAKEPDAIETGKRVFSYITIYLIWMGLGIALLTDNVLVIVATEEFWRASHVVAPILIYLLFASAVGFCTFSFLVSDRPAMVAKSYWFSSVLMTGLYFLLVPNWGELGTAWSKALAAAAQTAYIIYFSRKIYPLHLPWLRMGALLLLATIIYVASLSLDLTVVWQAWLADFALVMVFIACAVSLPFLAKKDRMMLREQFVKYVGKQPLGTKS